MRNTKLILVSVKHYPEVMERLAATRQGSSQLELRKNAEELNESILNDFGEDVSLEAFTSGRRYGVIGYSPTASAYRAGKNISGFGEVFLFAWTYGGDGVFWRENTWGEIVESEFPGCPLIEFPGHPLVENA